jgi:hypothetical protein
MGVIERIVVSDTTLLQLEQAAREHGRTVAQEAALRLEGEHEGSSRDELISRMRALRNSLPPQTSDSLALLREDRDR